MLSPLWIRFSLRQLMRTLGQQKALLPLLLISILTIPTAIVAVHEMAPHAHTAYGKLGLAKAAKVGYGFYLLMWVLLFPMQVSLIHELDASQEIENLQRFPVAGRALFHFKVIDQAVMFLPLMLLAVMVTSLGGLYRPLGPAATLVLGGCLLGLGLMVQLTSLFVVTAGLGMLPRRVLMDKLMMASAAIFATGATLAAVALLYPSYEYRRLLVFPWELIPVVVGLVQLGMWQEAALPAGFLLGELWVAYALAAWSYNRHLLMHRDELMTRLGELMGREQQSSVDHSHWFGRLLGRVWADPIPLLVLKDIKQVTRPPSHRLIMLLVGLPFGFLAVVVGGGIALGLPSPFEGGPITLYGRATLMLGLYGILTLLWIPCSQIFLFSFERWPVVLAWFGPIDAASLFKAKAIAASLVVMPAVLATYAGMGMAVAAGGGFFYGRLLLFGILFIGMTSWIFGQLVASLGILFPYYLHTRFRHLAGGMGFLMQLSLLPAWVQTWMLGLVGATVFGAPAAIAFLFALLMWIGFTRILAREARVAIDRIRIEFGKTAGTRED